jgi:hypothetical protein
MGGTKRAGERLSCRIGRERQFRPAKSKPASFGRASRANGRAGVPDEAASWEHSHERFEIERIGSQAAYGFDGARADMAAKHFGSLRRAEAGIFRDVFRSRRYAQAF